MTSATRLDSAVAAPIQREKKIPQSPMANRTKYGMPRPSPRASANRKAKTALAERPILPQPASAAKPEAPPPDWSQGLRRLPGTDSPILKFTQKSPIPNPMSLVATGSAGHEVEPSQRSDGSGCVRRRIRRSVPVERGPTRRRRQGPAGQARHHAGGRNRTARRHRRTPGGPARGRRQPRAGAAAHEGDRQ